MADSYHVIAAVTTTELVGGNQVQDVQQVTVMADPSRITFPVRVPSAGFGPDAVHAAAEPIAEALNELAADKRVAAITVSQDVDGAGMLVDNVSVTVRSSNGALTAVAVVPLSDVAAGKAEADVAAAVHNLDAVAGL